MLTTALIRCDPWLVEEMYSTRLNYWYRKTDSHRCHPNIYDWGSAGGYSFCAEVWQKFQSAKVRALSEMPSIIARLRSFDMLDRWPTQVEQDAATLEMKGDQVSSENRFVLLHKARCGNQLCEGITETLWEFHQKRMAANPAYVENYMQGHIHWRKIIFTEHQRLHKMPVFIEKSYREILGPYFERRTVHPNKVLTDTLGMGDDELKATRQSTQTNSRNS